MRWIISKFNLNRVSHAGRTLEYKQPDRFFHFDAIQIGMLGKFRRK